MLAVPASVPMFARMRLVPTLLLLAGFAVALPAEVSARSKFSWEEQAQIDKEWPQSTTTSTGLRYVILQPGSGDLPKPGDRITALYRGRLFNGHEFDRMTDPRSPFVFRLDRGDVIASWDEAFAQMRKGEKRLLIVPAALAYGTRGSPPRIPRNAGLVFEVEVLDFGPPPEPKPVTP